MFAHIGYAFRLGFRVGRLIAAGMPMGDAFVRVSIEMNGEIPF